MQFFRPLMAAFAITILGTTALADDSAEVKNLKEKLDEANNQVQVMSAKLKNLMQAKDNVEADMNSRIKKLMEDNERLRLKVDPNAGVARISDLLKANTSLSGDYQETPQCECTLSINEIDGKRFKGSHMLRVRGSDKATLQCDVEGAFGEQKLSYRSVNSNVQFKVTGTLKGNTIEIEYTDEKGTKGKGVLKLAR
jgi:hypothetical protein